VTTDGERRAGVGQSVGHAANEAGATVFPFRIVPPWCTRRDLNPHALRRRNLKANDARMDSVTSRDDEKRIDEQERAEEAVGATGGDAETVVDVVEAALADALTRAAAAGQWTTVEVLSRELTARREATAAVIDLGAARCKRRER